MKKLLVTVILSAVTFINVIADDSVEHHTIVNYLSTSIGWDFMASSTGDEMRPEFPREEKIIVHSALPVNLKYSFAFTDSNIRNYFPGGYQGIGLGILNIGAFDSSGIKGANHYIGTPIMLYVFQGAPFWKINGKVNLGYEWNFGASFGWKPYSDINDRFNLTVGSRVNAYINLALILDWKINRNLSVFGGLTATHFSNGNTSWPNPGVNSVGLKIGINYTLNPLKKEFPSVSSDTVKRIKPEYDISIWGASRKRVYKGGESPILRPGHYACAGITFAPMWSLNNWWRIGGGADLQWDQSSDMKRRYLSGDSTETICFTKPDFFRQLSFGISAHGELKMPIFAVNIGLGYNLIAPSENRGFYQNVTLKTYIVSNLFLNVGYQLRNFHQQSSLMLGIGITV